MIKTANRFRSKSRTPAAVSSEDSHIFVLSIALILKRIESCDRHRYLFLYPILSISPWGFMKISKQAPLKGIILTTFEASEVVIQLVENGGAVPPVIRASNCDFALGCLLGDWVVALGL